MQGCEWREYALFKIGDRFEKPGNAAIVYPLNAASDEEGICPAHWPATDILPVEIVRRVTENSGTQKLVVTLTAHQDVYFHFPSVWYYLFVRTVVYFTCPVFGIAVIFVLLKILLLFACPGIGQ